MLDRILAALGLRTERRSTPILRPSGDPPAASPGLIKVPPRYEPYRNPACNDIYNLLFCDDRRAPLGAMDDAPATLRAIADDEAQEGRNRMWAYNLLRERGEPVPVKVLLGVIVEAGLDDGLDVLAAFSDGSVRYINRAEKIGVFEGNLPQIGEQVQRLLAVSRHIVDQIGPWTEARLPPPSKGAARTTFLVSDGLYFGQGPWEELRSDPRGLLVLSAAEELLKAVVELGLASQPAD